MASKTPVGFVGLGNMGSPMAKNLLKNGYPVIATDVFPGSCKELQDMGAQVNALALRLLLLVTLCVTVSKNDVDGCPLQVVDSPAEVAEKADRIITMLPSSPNVIEVYTGPNGILKYANRTQHTPKHAHAVSFFFCFFFNCVQTASRNLNFQPIQIDTGWRFSSLNSHKPYEILISAQRIGLLQMSFGQMCLGVSSSKHTDGF